MPFAYVSSQKVQELLPQTSDSLSDDSDSSHAVPPLLAHCVIVRTWSRDPVPHDLVQSLQLVQAEYSQFTITFTAS